MFISNEGRREFLPRSVADPGFAAGEKNGSRPDQRHLVNEWLQRQKRNGIRNPTYVWNKTQLLGLNLNATDSVLGLFASSHLPMKFDDEAKNGEPGKDGIRRTDANMN